MHEDYYDYCHTDSDQKGAKMRALKLSERSVLLVLVFKARMLSVAFERAAHVPCGYCCWLARALSQRC
jgi:hypothetical protein